MDNQRNDIGDRAAPRKVNYMGCGKLYPEDPRSPRDLSGSIDMPFVVPEGAKPGDVLRAEFKMHAFVKKTEAGTKMLSLQGWATRERNRGPLKDRLWKLMERHPEITHWKTSEIHKRWFRAIRTGEIIKAAYELVDDGKVVVDPKMKRTDAVWFWRKGQEPELPGFGSLELDILKPDLPQLESTRDDTSLGGFSVVGSQVGVVDGAPIPGQGSVEVEKVKSEKVEGSPEPAWRKKTWRK